MATEGSDFNRGVIRPMECFREGWRLIKDDYWLFFGITVSGTMLGNVAFGILAGPLMCGIDICFFRRLRGQRVSFDGLFKGFDYFVPSLIATLILMVPQIVLMLIGSVGLFVGFFAIIASQPQQGPDANFAPLFLGLYAVVLIPIMLISMIINAFFIFTFPLIVDRRLSGWDAIKTSFRASWANLGGVLGLVLINMVLGFAGLLACYVGVVFVIPVTLAAAIMAYRKVFPEEEPLMVLPTGIQSADRGMRMP